MLDRSLPLGGDQMCYAKDAAAGRLPAISAAPRNSRWWHAILL
jgi:hypothetical protein